MKNLTPLINQNEDSWITKIKNHNKEYHHNVSSFFLLPLCKKVKNTPISFMLLGVNITWAMVYFDIVGTYKYLKEDKKDLRSLYLLFKESKLSENFLSCLEQHISIVDTTTLDIEDESYLLVTTKIIEEVPDKDIKLILTGKYSRISEETKKLYPTSTTFNCFNNSVYNIPLVVSKRYVSSLIPLQIKYNLDLTVEDVADVETWDLFDEEKETFSIENPKLPNICTFLKGD